MGKQTYTILLFVLLAGIARGQGLNLTQYGKSLLSFNPSGVATDNSAGLNFHYRQQALVDGEDAKTSIFTGIYPLMNKEKTKRKGGLGVSFLHDAQGENNNLVTQGLSAAYAYNLNIAQNQYISFGMLVGYFQQKIGATGFTTGSQWNPLTGFDPVAPIEEQFEGERKGFLSLGAGATYYKEDSEGRQLASLGVSGLGLNQPDISFTGEESILPVKYVVHGYAALLRNGAWTIGPEAYYARDNHQSFWQGGISVRRYFENSNPFDVLKNGFVETYARYREGNAAVLGVQLLQPNFAVGASYDIALSDNALPGNAFEITFTLRKPFTKTKPKAQQPTEEDYSLGEVRDFIFKKDQPVEQTDEGQAGEAEDNNETAGPDKNYRLALRKDFKFGFNQAELDEEGKAYLDELAALLKASPNLRLEVVGHTDDVGTPAANRKVSQQRANVVIAYLKAQGIGAKRLKASAKADKEPLVENNSEANRAKNRRVEFNIYE